MTTAITKHFLFHILWISIFRFLYFNFFSASFCIIIIIIIIIIIFPGFSRIQLKKLKYTVDRGILWELEVAVGQ
jgi:hypothetical protein